MLFHIIIIIIIIIIICDQNICIYLYLENT